MGNHMEKLAEFKFMINYSLSDVKNNTSKLFIKLLNFPNISYLVDKKLLSLTSMDLLNILMPKLHRLLKIILLLRWVHIVEFKSLNT